VVELNNDDGYAGALIDPGYVRPTDSFTDTSGAPWTFAAGAIRPVTLVTFGYTSCPDVCSAQLADLVAALRRIDPGLRQRIQVVWITVDPKRDTPDVIRTYLDRFDSTMVGLLASGPVLERAASQLGVGLSGEDGYEVGHGAHIIGFGPSGVSVVWVQGTPVGDLRADISRLASAA
jgi:protein SCO1/2